MRLTRIITALIIPTAIGVGFAPAPAEASFSISYSSGGIGPIMGTSTADGMPINAPGTRVIIGIKDMVFPATPVLTPTATIPIIRLRIGAFMICRARPNSYGSTVTSITRMAVIITGEVTAALTTLSWIIRIPIESLLRMKLLTTMRTPYTRVIRKNLSSMSVVRTASWSRSV